MQMSKRLNSVLLVFAVSVPCVGTAGELYKWVDDDGHVHYSDIENLPDTPTYATPVDAQITIVESVQVEKSESEISTTSPSRSSSSSTLLRSRQVDENSEAKREYRRGLSDFRHPRNTKVKGRDSTDRSGNTAGGRSSYRER